MTYTIKKNDTLGTISARFGLTISDIKKANNLSNVNLIKEGQTLEIPSLQVFPYKIKKNDTLGKIAKQHKLTTKNIIDANPKLRSNPNQLKIGDELIISKKEDPPKKTINKSKESYDEFKNKTAELESSGKYNAENRYGYLGRYQFGKKALETLGVYEPLQEEKQSKKYSGKFTGKYNIFSKDNLLNNPTIQDLLFDKYKRAQWAEAKSESLHKYLGKKITYGDKSIIITEAAILGGAQFGVGNVSKFIKSNGKEIFKDGNGVPITKYMEIFENYDVKKITEPK